jgi:hypothetical protein
MKWCRLESTRTARVSKSASNLRPCLLTRAPQSDRTGFGTGADERTSHEAIASIDGGANQHAKNPIRLVVSAVKVALNESPGIIGTPLGRLDWAIGKRKAGAGARGTRRSFSPHDCSTQ